MTTPEDRVGINPSENPPSPVRIPIPIYDPGNQILSSGVEVEDLALISRERDRVLLDIETSTGFPATESWDIGRVRGGLGLLWAIDHMPIDLGMRFDAHGVTQYPVLNLHKLLTDGITKRIMAMPFARVGELEAHMWGAPYPHNNGGVIIISGVDKYLNNDGIETVVLGEEYVGVIDLMRKNYPGFDFIPWNLAPKFLAKKLKETTGEVVEVEEATEENRPFYPNLLKEQQGEE